MTTRIKWIKDNPYTCVLPFSKHSINLEFDGQRDPKKQYVWFRNSCCCNLDSERSGFSDVQVSVLNNQFNSRCQKCYVSEQDTGTSERTMALMSLPESDFQYFLANKTLTTIDFGIKFSSLCNLSCRSCSPTFSSKYAELHNIKVPKELTTDISENIEYWNIITNDISSYVKQQKQVNISLFGGETLIQPGVSALLKWIDDENLSSKLSVSTTTNLTRIENLKLFSKFKNVQVSASIDSVQENYEYLRYPATWAQITENLKSIALLIRNKKITFTVQPLISLNNAFYLTDILDFWHKWITDHQLSSVSIKNVSMYRPFHLTIQNLPLEYRSQLAAEFNNALNHKIFEHDNHPEFVEYIKGMLHLLTSDELFANLFETYLFDTVKHDNATNSKMQIGNKKFYDLLTAEHRKILEVFYNDLNICHLDPIQKQKYLNNPL